MTQKQWDVTTKASCPGCPNKTFRVTAETNMDAKAIVVKEQFGSLFTGLFKEMTAKRVKEEK